MRNNVRISTKMMEHVKFDEQTLDLLNNDDKDTRIAEWNAQKARIASAVSAERDMFAETIAEHGAERFVPKGVSERQVLANRMQVLSTTSAILFDYDGYADSPKGLRSLIEETRERMFDVLTAMPEIAIATNAGDEATSSSLLLFLSDAMIGDWRQVTVEPNIYSPEMPDTFHLMEYLLQELFLQEERSKRFGQYIAMSEHKLDDTDIEEPYEVSRGSKLEGFSEEGGKQLFDDEVELLDALAVKCAYDVLAKCDEALASKTDVENGQKSIDEINNEIGSFFKVFRTKMGM